MEIVAHGIDLVDCPRIEQMIQRHGERFIKRVFTAAEQAYAQANKNDVEKLAGRFAAKEAILKLMGTGWRGRIAWTDIEIINNAAGQPEVTLGGEVRKTGKCKHHAYGKFRHCIGGRTGTKVTVLKWL